MAEEEEELEEEGGSVDWEMDGGLVKVAGGCGGGGAKGRRSDEAESEEDDEPGKLDGGFRPRDSAVGLELSSEAGGG